MYKLRYYSLALHPTYNLLLAGHESGFSIYKLLSNNQMEVNNICDPEHHDLYMNYNDILQQNIELKQQYAFKYQTKYRNIEVLSLRVSSLIIYLLNWFAVCYLNRYVFVIFTGLMIIGITCWCLWKYKHIVIADTGWKYYLKNSPLSFIIQYIVCFPIYTTSNYQLQKDMILSWDIISDMILS